jgi:hypothetical protein
VISSHDLDEVERRVDVVGFLDGGRLVLNESFADLHGRFRRIDVTTGQWPSPIQVPESWISVQTARASEEMFFRRRDTSRKQIAIPLSITGIPADEFVSAVATDSRLEVPGATLQSTQSAMVNVRRGAASEPSPNLLSSVRGALGNMQLLESETVDGYEEWPVVLTLAGSGLPALLAQPGALERDRRVSSCTFDGCRSDTVG